MKKKKLLITSIIFILFFCMIYKPIFIKADSGFDSSYDGGGSSGSDGSDSFSKAISIDTPAEAVTFFVIMIFITIIIILKMKKADLSIKKLLSSSPIEEFDISNKLPNFDVEEFNNLVFENYKKIQIAWMNFDLDSVRNIISDELYNMYSMQLETLKVKEQQNIMEDIEYNKNRIIDVKVENGVTTIVTKLQVTCKDYIIYKNKTVVRGNKNTKLCYVYRLTFVKNNESVDCCPNCGAKINNNSLNKCEYCASVLVNNSNDWIMTKKEMLGQSIVHK